MYNGLHVKYPLFLSNFNETLIYSTDFPKMLKYKNFMKNHPFGAELFHVDGWMDGLRQTDVTKANGHILQSRNVPKNCHTCWTLPLLHFFLPLFKA